MPRACSTATGSPSPTGGSRGIADAAGAAADELGGTVALKAQGPGLLHKSEMGAVRAGLSGAEEVRRAAEEMDAAVAAAGGERESFIVQAMAEPGPELLVGVVEDVTFGPVLACGAGGTQAELLKDVSVRICPVTRSDVEPDAPLAQNLSPPDRLPRRAAGGPGEARGSPPPGERDGRGPSRDRRDGSQSGGRRRPAEPSRWTTGSGCRAPRRAAPGPRTWK